MWRNFQSSTAVMWRGISSKNRWRSAHPIKVDERRVDEGGADFDVVDCQYATFFNATGEPELRFLLACRFDFDMLASTTGIELRRIQKMMHGVLLRLSVSVEALVGRIQ